MKRTLQALVCAALLAASSVTVAAAEASAAPWFGGRVETADVALTIPDDWVAVDIDGDLRVQSESIAQQVWETTGNCVEASCAEDVHAWLEGEETTVRLLATGIFGDDSPAGTCRVHHAASRQGRPLGEFASIIHDVFAGSPGVEVTDVPRALTRDDAVAYTFDFADPEGEVEGTVYVVGGANRFVWMRCEGRTPPADRWSSITGTLELIGDRPESTPAGAEPGDIQTMLPVWVAGRPLLSYSHRGLDYLPRWSRITEEQLRELEDDPHALDGSLPGGAELDDIEFANAGRASPDDPAHFVSALRFRGVPASALPVSLVVDHDVGTWEEARFGDRVVRGGTEEMLDQQGRPGRPYVNDVGDVRFVVTTNEEAWAREAIARLRPEAAIENADLFVSLPETWYPGMSPVFGEVLDG